MVMMIDVLADHQMKFSRSHSPRQNSFIMLSLDLPTPTHFTKKRKHFLMIILSFQHMLLGCFFLLLHM